MRRQGEGRCGVVLGPVRLIALEVQSGYETISVQ